MPPTPPPRKLLAGGHRTGGGVKSSSFRKKLPCLCQQDSADVVESDLESQTRPLSPSASARELEIELEQHGLVSGASAASDDEEPSRPVRKQRPRALSHIASSLRFAPVPALAVAGFGAESNLFGSRGSPLRASYHGKPAEKQYLSDVQPSLGADAKARMEIVGSAESMVGRILHEQGLGKYCDESLIQVTQRELAEAFNMTPQEMDRAAQRLLDKQGASLTPSMTPSPRPSELERGAHGGSRRSDRRVIVSTPVSDEEEDKYRDTKL